VLAVAHQHQSEAGLTNVHFEYRDAAQTGFADQTFDVISSRRGPSFAAEYWRVLKGGGHFLYLGIGERDAQGIKQMFGRGQFFGRWDEPFLHVEQHALSDAGFTIVHAEEFWFDEYY
jgi:ubiquinone/menaquinone biosynthesis C-methylase UbiE